MSLNPHDCSVTAGPFGGGLDCCCWAQLASPNLGHGMVHTVNGTIFLRSLFLSEVNGKIKRGAV